MIVSKFSRFAMFQHFFVVRVFGGWVLIIAVAVDFFFFLIKIQNDFVVLIVQQQ